MPTRLLREGILTSARINQLDSAEEVFYRRLMSKVDDYGLADANPAILRPTLYPLKVDRVREADISRWMAACQKAGLIVLYEAAGKPYLRMLDTNWKTRSAAKYPLPDENSCSQLKTSVPLVVDVVVDVVGDVVVDVDGGKTKRTKNAKEPAFFALPDFIPRQPWEDFLQFRKEKRSPMTERAKELAITTLTRLHDRGEDCGAVLDQSTQNGWTSLRPVKADQRVNGPGGLSVAGSQTAESLKRFLARKNDN